MTALTTAAAMLYLLTPARFALLVTDEEATLQVFAPEPEWPKYQSAWKLKRGESNKLDGTVSVTYTLGDLQVALIDEENQ